MVDSASALGLSRRRFLKTAALVPAVAPMVAAAGAGNALGYLQGGFVEIGEFIMPAMAPAASFEGHPANFGRALHHIPVPLRRIDGKYVGEVVTFPTPITASERESRAALARSVLPLAAQVQWGLA